MQQVECDQKMCFMYMITAWCKQECKVWKKIIFRYLEDYKYNVANIMTDIRKIPFDYCLDINSWQLNYFYFFDLLMTLTLIFDIGVWVDTSLALDAPN